MSAIGSTQQVLKFAEAVETRQDLDSVGRSGSAEGVDNAAPQGTAQQATLAPDQTAALILGVRLPGQVADTGVHAGALPVLHDGADGRQMLAALGREG